MRSPYRPLVWTAAARAGLDPWLVEAIVAQESAGRADAFRYEPAFWERYCKFRPEYADEEPRRIASSYGLMQVMYTTAIAHGYEGPPEGLFDIETNLRVGCAVLAALLDRFEQDRAKALAAYNGGVLGISRPVPMAYARAVIARYELLVSRGSPAGRSA